MCKISVVIVSAGRGQRLSPTPKQFLPLNGKFILFHTLERFDIQPISEVVIVLNEDWQSFCTSDAILSCFKTVKNIKITTGASSRQASVYEGLKRLSPQCEYCLIHDAARPLLKSTHILEIIKQVQQNNCVLGVKAKETMKIVDDKGLIQSTLNRESLWSIQTPQAFKLETLLQAYEAIATNSNKTLADFTDDAAIVEAFGESVKMVEGSYDNIKITTKEDLILAELLIKEMSKQGEY